VATFDQFIASLEQDFGEQGKGKPFEVFCKWFLENDPKWSKTSKCWTGISRSRRSYKLGNPYAVLCIKWGTTFSNHCL